MGVTGQELTSLNGRQISADVASSQEIVQRNIIESLELQLARAQEQLSSKFDASIQASMSQLLVEIERRGTLVTKAGDDSAPKGDEVVLKAYGSNNTRTANTAVDAYSPHRIISSCSWACGCNCHSLSSHTSWRLACFGQMFGSLAVSYHGFSNRQRRCTERSCRNNPTGGWLRLHYTFPRWLTDLSVLAAYRASQPRPEAVIRICRRVPMTDPNSVFDPIRKNDVEALKRLLSLEPFAAIDEEESGRPCISVALHFHRYDMVELLLRAGADPHRPDGLGHTAASDFFLEFNARPGSNSEAAFRCMPGMRAPLAEYIDNAGFLQVHKVVTGLIPVPLRDLIRSEKVSRQINHQVAENKWSPLFLAACRDDAENVSLLLDAGADPRLPTRYGSTPLHAASRQANLQMIEKLIHAGADPSQQDMSGCTAMSFVVDRWDPWTPRILTLMLEHGAGVNTVIIKSQNVQLLAQAAVRGHHKSVEWLVDHGADIEAQDSDGDTALLDCVVGSTCLSARVLLDHGANYKHVNKRGGTILHNLAIMGDAEAFRFWAGRSLEGLDSEKRDEMGRTPREWFEERRIMTEELREGFEGLIESVTSGSGGGERRGERKGERGDKGGGSYGEARGENDDAEFFDAVERQG